MSPFLPADLRVRAESAVEQSKKTAIRCRKLKHEQIRLYLEITCLRLYGPKRWASPRWPLSLQALPLTPPSSSAKISPKTTLEEALPCAKGPVSMPSDFRSHP